MSITLNDFQNHLSPEEFLEVQNLAGKSMLTITAEEKQRFEDLQKKVSDAVALSKKTESLDALKNKDIFSITEIITFLKNVGWSKEDFNKALKEVFPAPAPVPSPILAVYKTKINGKEEVHNFQINDGKRLSGDIGNYIKEGGLDLFKKNITTEGIAWLNADATKITLGKAVGEWKRDNLNDLKKARVEWFKDEKKRDAFAKFLDEELDKAEKEKSNEIAE